MKTKRVPIYPRVTAANAEWVGKYGRKTAKSEARFVDGILTYARKKLSVKQLQRMFDGTQA